MESCKENLGMLSQIMERWHANCTDSVLGQQKHVMQRLHGLKDTNAVSSSLCRYHIFSNFSYRVWSPTNSEQPLHENKLIHDIRKGRNIYGAVFAISFDHKSRPYNTDFIQHESSAKFYVCPN